MGTYLTDSAYILDCDADDTLSLASLKKDTGADSASWISLSGSNVVVSGAPSTEGDYNYHVGVSDGTYTQVVPITITVSASAPQPPTFTGTYTSENVVYNVAATFKKSLA